MQRYLLSYMFISLNGTNWGESNLWLSEESECLWFGLSCNANFQIESLALDENNVFGMVSLTVAVTQQLV